MERQKGEAGGVPNWVLRLDRIGGMDFREVRTGRDGAGFSADLEASRLQPGRFRLTRPLAPRVSSSGRISVFWGLGDLDTDFTDSHGEERAPFLPSSVFLRELRVSSSASVNPKRRRAGVVKNLRDALRPALRLRGVDYDRMLTQHGSIMSDAATPHQTVAQRRDALGWSQAELARRAGIPRTTVSAIEGERLTPSVRTALLLARVLECTVEELFGHAGAERGTSGAQWAWRPRSEPSRYWEAEVGGRRWWYPAESLAVNGLGHDGVWDGERGGEPDRSIATSTLVMATCDPAAGLMAREYARASGFRLLVFPRGGREALDLLGRGLVHIAGVHRSTPEYPERNVEMVRSLLGDSYCGVRAAEWTEGLVCAADHSSRSPESLLKNAKRWALREAGSAARECLDELSGGRDLRGRAVSGHGAVAEAVRSGWADAGVCVKLCADEAGLNFLPVRTELLDLCFPKAMEWEPRLLALVRLLRSASHRRLIGELPGYDTRHMGEFVAN